MSQTVTKKVIPGKQTVVTDAKEAMGGEKKLPDKLLYSGTWKSTIKDYAGRVAVTYDTKKRYAKVQFVVEEASGPAKLVLPYRKILEMHEKEKDKGKEKEKHHKETDTTDPHQFPKLSGEVLGVKVSFSLDKTCIIGAPKLHGTYSSRGTLIDDDGKFKVKNVEEIEKSFEESKKCVLM